MSATIPASAVIPTRDRVLSLSRTLSSLLGQGTLPAELIVVDASSDGATRAEVEVFASKVVGRCSVHWLRADTGGAAAQRNRGVSVTTQPFVWFFDDDIVFEPDCVIRLWRAIEADVFLGGVSATIVNQQYRPPGPISRLLFTILDGRHQASFAGRVIGPAVNLLPEDRDEMPEVVPVDWLNTTCTLYRREAMPDPPFDSVFTGYSMMEDLALSLRVGRTWRLANARTARMFHDSQPGEHKNDVTTMAAMELVNRHYVMTEILGRRRVVDYCQFVAWEAFQVGVCAARRQTRPSLAAMCQGKIRGVRQIMQPNLVSVNT